MRSLVISAEQRWGSVGRALAIGEALAFLGDVTVAAFDDGPLWVGSDAFRTPVRTYRSFDELVELVRELDGEPGEPRLIFACKPFERSLDWAHAARAAAGVDATFVMDFDEDDAAVNARWQNDKAPLDRAKTWLVHERSPLQLERRIRRHIADADLLTVACWEVRRLLPPRVGPEARVVHARPAVPLVAPEPSDRLRIGFLGTLQTYKGTDVLSRLLAARENLELHLLDVREHAPPELTGDRVVFHDRAGPETLRRAFRQVDVVVLPQDLTSDAARWQTPMKLLDALRHGVPVIATPTPPIMELAGEVIFPVQRWDPLDEALAHLDALADPTVREAAAARSHRFFGEHLAAEVQARQLSAVLDNLSAHGRGEGRIQGPLDHARRAWRLVRVRPAPG
jgi:glycosyltransferase involved in cell wall biosynthesis